MSSSQRKVLFDLSGLHLYTVMIDNPGSIRFHPEEVGFPFETPSKKFFFPVASGLLIRDQNQHADFCKAVS